MKRLPTVIRRLVCGFGGIKDRLREAGRDFLEERGPVPEQYAREHEEIVNLLTEEGEVEQTVDAMSEREASEVAKKLFYLFAQYAESERLSQAQREQ